jgi:hypothetical protein
MHREGKMAMHSRQQLLKAMRQILLDRGKIGMPLYHPILKTPLI